MPKIRNNVDVTFIDKGTYDRLIESGYTLEQLVSHDSEKISKITRSIISKFDLFIYNNLIKVDRGHPTEEAFDSSIDKVATEYVEEWVYGYAERDIVSSSDEDGLKYCEITKLKPTEGSWDEKNLIERVVVIVHEGIANKVLRSKEDFINGFYLTILRYLNDMNCYSYIIEQGYLGLELNKVTYDLVRARLNRE